jgi:hypothetical protein
MEKENIQSLFDFSFILKSFLSIFILFVNNSEMQTLFKFLIEMKNIVKTMSGFLCDIFKIVGLNKID